MEARTGVVEGPIFALSTRGSTNFSTEMDQAIDLGREVVAALISAQHRAREGREEKRFGDGKWWCTKPRWGGGPGGPIGKEAEAQEAKAAAAAATANSSSSKPVSDDSNKQVVLVGNGNSSKTSIDPKSSDESEKPKKDSKTTESSNNDSRPPATASLPRRIPARKSQMSIYDSYRMVRPPSCTWDKKARYLSIGKIPGADYDEVFVVSSLFHHVCFLRIRVPHSLLEVLDGGNCGPGTEIDEIINKPWGGVEMVKSQWFDLFVPTDRVKAMQHIWAIMLWAMRKTDQPQPANVEGSTSQPQPPVVGASADDAGVDKMDIDDDSSSCNTGGNGKSQGPCPSQ